MTTIAGAVSYALAIATADSSGTPTGSIIYLTAPEVNISWQNMTSIQHIAGRTSYSTREAKRVYKINVNNAFINPQVSNNTIEEINDIIEYIDDWTDLAHAPVLLYVADASLNGTHNQLEFKDDGGDRKKYLSGYPMNVRISLKAKVTFATMTLDFEECWM